MTVSEMAPPPDFLLFAHHMKREHALLVDRLERAEKRQAAVNSPHGEVFRLREQCDRLEARCHTLETGAQERGASINVVNGLDQRLQSLEETSHRRFDDLTAKFEESSTVTQALDGAISRIKATVRDVEASVKSSNEYQDKWNSQLRQIHSTLSDVEDRLRTADMGYRGLDSRTGMLGNELARLERTLDHNDRYLLEAGHFMNQVSSAITTNREAMGRLREDTKTHLGHLYDICDTFKASQGNPPALPTALAPPSRVHPFPVPISRQRQDTEHDTRTVLATLPRHATELDHGQEQHAGSQHLAAPSSTHTLDFQTPNSSNARTRQRLRAPLQTIEEVEARPVSNDETEHTSTGAVEISMLSLPNAAESGKPEQAVERLRQSNGRFLKQAGRQPRPRRRSHRERKEARLKESALNKSDVVAEQSADVFRQFARPKTRSQTVATKEVSHSSTLKMPKSQETGNALAFERAAIDIATSGSQQFGCEGWVTE